MRPMATPPPPHLPRLKRFANLDIDGVSRPARPPKAAPPLAARAGANPRPTLPPEDAVERAARALGAELSDNARTSIGNTRPEAMRQSRAADLRRMRPADPLPTPRAMRPAFSPDELPPDATPGVITIELGARRDGGSRREPLSPLAPRGRAPAPIEVTPLAARQILLMAWQSGMQGSGLRILMTRVPGLGGPELDFAFDDHATPDDVVFESGGIRVLCDSATLAWARGRRITFHVVPTEVGIGAFRLA
jgi:Fe-S cluster assembly iron-binding protein IscA